MIKQQLKIPKQGYKLTEIGEIPEDWEVVSVLKGLGKKKFKVGKIKQLDYKEIGKIPVVDQGSNYIAGYSDDEEKAYKGDLPVIIFGDHTRIIKYIDFSFIMGADGVKVLLPDRDIFYPKFFYYALLNLQVESRGYNRHFSILKEKILPLPLLTEQQKIAEILSTADEDIQKTDEIIAKTQELKKGMMQQLLTRGIGHARFKKTEIGEIPEEWEVVRLGDVLKFIKNGLTYKQNKEGLGFPVTRIETISNSIIDESKVGYINKLNDKELEEYKLEVGDILFSHINSVKHIAKSAIYVGTPPLLIHGMNLLLLRSKKEKINPLFLLFYLKYDKTRDRFRSWAKKAVNQASINQTEMKLFELSLPLLPEQKKIAEILSTIDEKIEIERKRKEKLEELKKGLMQNLLTGKVRVKI